MDLGEQKRTVIVQPLVIPVPQRTTEREVPQEQPQLQPAETEK